MINNILLICFLPLTFCFGQSAEPNGIDPYIDNLNSVKRNERMLEIGEKFLGRPYLVGSLESKEEKLICRLDGFDCYTFVETVLALALTAEENAPSEEIFREEMQFLRYRDGEIDGYPSRIHYFFEWAKLAEENGILKDLTPKLGRHSPKNINFMSTHRAYYPAFKTNDLLLDEIKSMEKKVNQYPFYQINKNNFKSVEKEIKNGDILAFTSTIKGLDVNHEGLAYWKGEQLHFLHASSEKMEVVISDETLSTYLNRIKKHSGIMVLRVNPK